MTYTEKQKVLLRDFKNNKLKRLNILHGSVRSGKTWISLVVWAFWVALNPKDKSYLMVAKTLTSLKRNCLDLLEGLVGKKNFTYSLPAKEGCLFGRKIYLEGVNDARAESKIRGMTLQGAYCDEVTLYSEDFFSMLLSRLSEHGAKLFGTTNPDSPFHWFKVNYLDRVDELDMYEIEFLIDENTFLDKHYVEELKKEYTGVYYKRYILSQWVTADGLIYDMFDEKEHIKDVSGMAFDRYYISIDYGTQNPTTFLLFGHNDGKWYGIKEYYYSGREKQRQKTDSEFADDLIEFIGDIDYRYIIIDPSAASFIAELRKRGLRIKKANNAVLDGIRLVGSKIQNGYLFLDKSMENTIKEISTYSWDSKAAQHGEDKPIKANDHSMDAMRYFVSTVLKPHGVSVLK